MKKFSFTIEGNKYAVELKSFQDTTAVLEVNGTEYTVEVDHEAKQTKTPTIIRSAPVSSPQEQGDKMQKAGGKLTSPLPGNIFKVEVRDGDVVKKGDTLLVIEAMKMENDIKAEKDAVIKSVKVKPGDKVLQGDVLIEMV